MSQLDALQRVMDDSGLWSGTGANYRFLLSPDVCRVSPDREAWLQRLGLAIQEVLRGVDVMLVKASDPRLSGRHGWSQCLRVNRVGVPARYRQLEAVEPGTLPNICKVDLMESVDGHLYVAEIDGHNKHGMGYSTLASRLAAAAEPEGCQFPGVAACVAAWMDTEGEDRLGVLCADQEVFYLPESRLFAAEMGRYGKEVVVAQESTYGLIGGQPRLMADLPFMHRNISLHPQLAELYRRGGVRFLIPPKPWTGSKALLALVRNDHGDKELEMILCDHIPADSLAFLRQAIPETYLVRGSLSNLPISSAEGFVAKEVVSSGMKGTIFTDDSRFEAALVQACRSNGRTILQREVMNQPRRYRYFSPEGELREAEWFQRITVHYAGPKVANIVVTARQDKRVHGAPDCLQLGAIRE